MNNKDKYTVSNLSDAVDKAVDVSFAQMIDTVRTQCYMSQTQDSWDDCTELEFLEDIPMLFTDGRKIKESIQNQMKRVVISALTDSDWVGKNDAMYPHLPSDIDTPQIDGIPNGDKLSDTDDLFHFGEYKHSNKFFQTNNKTHCYLNDSENSVMILALETLLEQVRDARDFEQIARVKNLLDSWKTLDDSRK
tara:strand:- start:2444 stop:3019 length:576 start_codon:yes stop_codon:yes gene_type:complete